MSSSIDFKSLLGSSLANNVQGINATLENAKKAGFRLDDFSKELEGLPASTHKKAVEEYVYHTVVNAVSQIQQAFKVARLLDIDTDTIVRVSGLMKLQRFDSPPESEEHVPLLKKTTYNLKQLPCLAEVNTYVMECLDKFSDENKVNFMIIKYIQYICGSSGIDKGEEEVVNSMMFCYGKPRLSMFPPDNQAWMDFLMKISGAKRYHPSEFKGKFINVYNYMQTEDYRQSRFMKEDERFNQKYPTNSITDKYLKVCNHVK